MLRHSRVSSLELDIFLDSDYDIEIFKLYNELKNLIYLQYADFLLSLEYRFEPMFGVADGTPKLLKI